MCNDPFQRTRLLFGEESMQRLRAAHVAVFGVGGVGGYAAEALARSAVGRLTLIDNDVVRPSNINRQIYALHSSIGDYKVDVARQRILDINPDCCVEALRMFYLPDNADEIDLTQYDYVVDCIDTITAKVELVKRCYRDGVRILSCMGAALKTDPSAMRVSTLDMTRVDPIAKIMRKKLRDSGITQLKVVYSEEQPAPFHKEGPLPSNAFVPAAMGLTAAGAVVKDIIQWTSTTQR